MNIKMIGLGVAALGVVIVGVFLAQQGGEQEVPGVEGVDIGPGIDISNTSWEDVESARDAVRNELDERKSKAGETHAAELEAASDSYWEKRRGLDADLQECETQAQLADPCKDLFEQASGLAQEILQGVENGQGFDETKFQQREDVKKKYDECLENPPRESTTAGMLEKCQGDFNLGNQIALDQRAEEEFAADIKQADTVEAAELQALEKDRILDAIDQECKDTELERRYGNLPSTGIPVTDYMGGSPACTGIFPGRDPDIQRQISNLRSQKNKADAAGKREGFLGSIHLQERITELENEMAAGDAKCTTDADCGGPDPVCCNITEIGRAFCSDGVCSNEKTACEAEEVCAGKPAMCYGFIQVIEYQGSYIPTSQLRIGEIHPKDENGNGCESRHWHADGPVTATDGTVFNDPDHYGCGFDPIEKRPAFNIRGNPSSSSGNTSSGSGSPGVSSPAGGSIQIRGGIFGN
jgi:hypothetical protein